MGSICGDFRTLSRRQLYSTISELKRENTRLKTDLFRLQLLSNKCQKYLHFLCELNETIDTNIENDFIKQINSLKDTKNCKISLNHIKVNHFSNRKSIVII